MQDLILVLLHDGSEIDISDADAKYLLGQKNYVLDEKNGRIRQIAPVKPSNLRKIKAFVNGVAEFRCNVTTGYDDADEFNAYEWGREIAHRITLRRYDA